MKFCFGAWAWACLLCLFCLDAFAQTTVFEEPLSPRIANYHIDVRLDTSKNRISGKLFLLWFNKQETTPDDLRFHLYLNAFRNTQTTFMQEGGGRYPGLAGLAFSEIQTIRTLPAGPGSNARDVGTATLHPDPEQMVDVTSSLTFLSPDDGNPADRSYFKIVPDQPVKPNEAVWVYITWEAALPTPPTNRTGFVDTFYFLGQWFPKIAVYQKGAWTDHQYHLMSEYFADFGVYDVYMTVPEQNLLGATGQQAAIVANGDGTSTHYYHAEDVHDFAFTTSPDFVEVLGEEQDVAIRVLLQKDHLHQAQRHVDATAVAIRYLQDWFGDYPYPNVTVVDPRMGAEGVGGMEYPTLFTAGTDYFKPEGVRDLEAVILHEFAHNYWQHLVASNEFEESWLDEGLTSYTEARVLDDAYGYPFEMLGFKINSLDIRRFMFGERPKLDAMRRKSWEYYSNGSYGQNSYIRPVLMLYTLENMVGVETMRTILRTYADRWRFAHPTTRDLMDVVNEVTGQNYDWFFDQVLDKNVALDYSISYISNKREKHPRGYDFTRSTDGEKLDAATGSTENYISKIKVRRIGEFVMPVELAFTYADGEVIRETWDGKEMWKIYEISRPSPLVSATVDPDFKIPLDVNVINNSRSLDTANTKPVDRAMGPWLVRLQSLFELLSL